MMALTGSVSGGGGFVEADPGGFVLEPPSSSFTITLTGSAAVSTVQQTSGNHNFLIPTSSNYCVVLVGGSGSVGPEEGAHHGGAGGSLAYLNGFTIAHGDTLVLEAGKNSNSSINYNSSTGSINTGYGAARLASSPSASGTFSSATTRKGGNGGHGFYSDEQYQGSGAGGDAATFTSNGSNGANALTTADWYTNKPGGDGINLVTGATTSQSAGTGGSYGGGPGGRGLRSTDPPAGTPTPGAIRLIWGLNRAFPSTNSGDSSGLTNGTSEYSYAPT